MQASGDEERERLGVWAIVNPQRVKSTLMVGPISQKHSSACQDWAHQCTRLTKHVTVNKRKTKSASAQAERKSRRQTYPMSVDGCGRPRTRKANPERKILCQQHASPLLCRLLSTRSENYFTAASAMRHSRTTASTGSHIWSKKSGRGTGGSCERAQTTTRCHVSRSSWRHGANNTRSSRCRDERTTDI